jgi:hypothetical protein
MMTGIGVHHRPEGVFTFDRNNRSRWAGIRKWSQFRSGSLTRIAKSPQPFLNQPQPGL